MKNKYGQEIEKIKKEYLFIVVAESYANPQYHGNQYNTIEIDRLSLSSIPYRSILLKALRDDNKITNVQGNGLIGFYYEKELAFEHCKISNKDADKLEFSRVIKIGSIIDETITIPKSKEKNHLYVIWWRDNVDSQKRREADEEYWNEIMFGWLSMSDLEHSPELCGELHGGDSHNKFVVDGGMIGGIYGIHTDCWMAREHFRIEKYWRNRCNQDVKMFITCIPMSKIKKKK